LQEPWYPIPADEDARLAALRAYGILDSEPEPPFDDLVAMARDACDTPIALISLVDADRQWFKAALGVDAKETPRCIAFCAHAIMRPEVFEVRDTQADERFKDNPLVTGAPFIRFYAGVPLRGSTGHALGTLCVIDDRPKALEARQRATLERLARQVVQNLELRKRTTELEDARRRAEAAARVKSEFLAMMSHEIRTPMNGILGAAEILSGLELTPDQRDLIDIVVSSSRGLLRILNDILDLSKLESASIELERTSFELRETGRDVVRLFEPIARSKGLDLNYRVGPDVPAWVVGDSARLGQVLTNLVGNALKFTSKGSVSLDISRSGEEIRFEVVDTGIGIGPEQMERLFQPFTQADASVTRRFGGTGLGLTICCRLVDRMGGRIRVESAPGQGSRFWFEIDLPPGEAVFGRSTDTGSIELPARLDVLLAEDNPVSASVASRMLEDLGCSVTLAEDGDVALDLLDQGRFDVALLDLHMPVLGGVEVARRVCARPGRPVLVALTASATTEDRDRCLDAGMDDFLSKPVTRGELARMLAKWSGPEAGAASA
jgi:signal transduction histidine kinase/CheY-like chemotaxis protein